jgi:isoleucyl-tRNA synthetase
MIFIKRKFSKNSISIWDSSLLLPKTSIPIREKIEDDLYKSKISTDLYQILNNSEKSRFTILDGPPFANGDLHVGNISNFY